MDRSLILSPSSQVQRTGSYLLRGVLAIDFVRFSLSFSPWFEGSETQAGEADRLFGIYRFSGFRADFVWLAISTLVIFFSMLLSLSNFRRDLSAKVNSYLCLAWIGAFIIYIGRLLFSGLLDFG
jgi:hypothetical protein